jgi:hypothetical protein
MPLRLKSTSYQCYAARRRAGSWPDPGLDLVPGTDGPDSGKIGVIVRFGTINFVSPIQRRCWRAGLHERPVSANGRCAGERCGESQPVIIAAGWLTPHRSTFATGLCRQPISIPPSN